MQTRAQVILLCFLVSSVLLVQFSSIDIRVSSAFFEEGFYFRDEWYATWLRNGVTYFLWLSIASVAGMYAFNRFSRQNLCGVDGRKVLYLLMVLIIGAGLIVNVILKDNFGRARPRDVEEFGGTKQFTPAFVISDECHDNCSFSSGEGAGAFYSLSLALAFSRRREMLLAGIAFGGVVSLGRIAAGAHFFSDSVVSFFVMLLVTDVLYYYMFVPGASLRARGSIEAVGRPKPSAVAVDN